MTMGAFVVLRACHACRQGAQRRTRPQPNCSPNADQLAVTVSTKSHVILPIRDAKSSAMAFRPMLRQQRRPSIVELLSLPERFPPIEHSGFLRVGRVAAARQKQDQKEQPDRIEQPKLIPVRPALPIRTGGEVIDGTDVAFSFIRECAGATAWSTPSSSVYRSVIVSSHEQSERLTCASKPWRTLPDTNGRSGPATLP